MIRTAILTVGDADDTDRLSEAVQAIRQLLVQGPFAEVDLQHAPGEQAIIRAKLRVWGDGDAADLVLTLGGIGLALRDRTPEATLEVIERPVPGMVELMRLVGLQKTRRAALYRAVAGVRRGTLIVNLPGNATEAHDWLEAILGILPPAIAAVSVTPQLERSDPSSSQA